MKIWVIGGTSGIGKACAEDLRLRGRDVTATGKELDVRDFNMMMALWSQADGFDAAVYSAGVNELNWLEETSDRVMLATYHVNVVGFTNLLRLVAMNGGKTACRSVVAISSDAAERPMRTSTAYCASKAALNMVVKCAARELAANVRVNAVSPGMVEGTEMTAYIDRTVPEIRNWSSGKAKEYEKSQIPIGRRANTSEIARVVHDVLFGPDYLTGSIITVNGGR